MKTWTFFLKYCSCNLPDIGQQYLYQIMTKVILLEFFFYKMQYEASTFLIVLNSIGYYFEDIYYPLDTTAESMDKKL